MLIESFEYDAPVKGITLELAVTRGLGVETPISLPNSTIEDAILNAARITGGMKDCLLWSIRASTEGHGDSLTVWAQPGVAALGKFTDPDYLPSLTITECWLSEPALMKHVSAAGGETAVWKQCLTSSGVWRLLDGSQEPVTPASILALYSHWEDPQGHHHGGGFIEYGLDRQTGAIGGIFLEPRDFDEVSNGACGVPAFRDLLLNRLFVVDALASWRGLHHALYGSRPATRIKPVPPAKDPQAIEHFHSQLPELIGAYNQAHADIEDHISGVFQKLRGDPSEVAAHIRLATISGFYETTSPIKTARRAQKLHECGIFDPQVRFANEDDRSRWMQRCLEALDDSSACRLVSFLIYFLDESHTTPIYHQQGVNALQYMQRGVPERLLAIDRAEYPNSYEWYLDGLGNLSTKFGIDEVDAATLSKALFAFGEQHPPRRGKR